MQPYLTREVITLALNVYICLVLMYALAANREINSLVLHTHNITKYWLFYYFFATVIVAVLAICVAHLKVY